MSNFQETKDGRIFIRTPVGFYEDTRANFEADFGIPLEPLPQGAVERLYEPGVRHALNSIDGNTIGGGPREGWKYGDDAIAACETLKAAQANRRFRSQN